LTKQTENVEEEFLTKDIIVSYLIVFDVGMRLIKSLWVSVLVHRLFFCVIVRSFLKVQGLREVDQVKIVRELLGALPEVIVVPQVEEEVKDLLLCFGPHSVFIQEEHQNVLVKGAVV